MNERSWVEMHEALLLVPANVVTSLTRPSALGRQEAVVAFGIFGSSRRSASRLILCPESS